MDKAGAVLKTTRYVSYQKKFTFFVFFRIV